MAEKIKKQKTSAIVKIARILKVAVELYLVLLYGIFCYLKLAFHTIIPPRKKSLDGEVLLITGSGTGIGREVALQISENHPKTTLILWDVNVEENKKTANLVRKLGSKAHEYEVDVTDRKRVEEVAQQVREEVGDVTILMNNAGIVKMRDMISANPEDLERTIQVNLISHFWTIRSFLPRMIERKRGHIVTVASLGSFAGSKYGSAYFASKYGIRGMIESIQDEMRIHSKKPDIKFSTIYPFFVKTELTRGLVLKVRGEAEERAWLNVKDVASTIIDGIQRERENVVIPRAAQLAIHFKNFVPNAFFQKICSTFFDGDVDLDDDK